jgi:hypothetical protein
MKPDKHRIYIQVIYNDDTVLDFATGHSGSFDHCRNIVHIINNDLFVQTMMSTTFNIDISDGENLSIPADNIKRIFAKIEPVFD